VVLAFSAHFADLNTAATLAVTVAALNELAAVIVTEIA
jgi:hypothetical protein